MLIYLECNTWHHLFTYHGLATLRLHLLCFVREKSSPWPISYKIILLIIPVIVLIGIPRAEDCILSMCSILDRTTFALYKQITCDLYLTEPPCLYKLRKNLPVMLVRGQPRVLPGVYVPSCDQDGFYLPRQCRTTDKNGNKECWCVDRNGSKIEGLTECGK